MSGDGWGQRWQAVLDAAPPAATRAVQRGQALARRGAVADVSLEPGRVTGRVREDRVASEQAEILWPVPDEEIWEQAVEALAAEVRFTAALLDGSLPIEAAALFADLGVPLLPELAELHLCCTCGAPVQPCPHVAAVHVAAGLRIERQPTVLLTLRGRQRDDLLRSVRAERGSGTHSANLGIELPNGLEAAGDLESVVVHPALAADPGALLDHLGEPPGVEDLTLLTRTVERAAATAWRLAAGDGAQAADEELLLAELRAQRVASAASLAEALGREQAAVAAQLDALFEAGTVLRTGSGERARYRASG